MASFHRPANHPNVHRAQAGFLAFVVKLAPSFEANTVIRSIVDLAHGMSMRILVEGVESIPIRDGEGTRRR